MRRQSLFYFISWRHRLGYLACLSVIFASVSQAAFASSETHRVSRLSDRGRQAVGIYAPVPRVHKARGDSLAKWVQRIGANAVVIDVKDDRGRVTFSRELPDAKGRQHGISPHIADLVQSLKAHDIYVIARVVCFKDHQLARLRPDIAIIDRRTKTPWRDRTELGWVDPHSQVARDHIVRVAVAAQEMGFDEIQLDYVRFPVERAAAHAVYPHRKERTPRYMVIAQLLAEVDSALTIPLSIDVFGLTAYNPGDADGLGQWLEYLAPYVDAISPMVYLANWPAKYYEKPSHAATYRLIEGAVRRIDERLERQVLVRPLLQGFQWRADQWGPRFIDNQIEAALDGGAHGFLFWNQGGSYRLLSTVLQQRAKKASPAASPEASPAASPSEGAAP